MDSVYNCCAPLLPAKATHLVLGYMCRVDPAGPLHMQALGSGPCSITKPLFHIVWKP